MAITVEVYTARRAYEIAAEYRRRGVPVILGGFHPTMLPEECQQYADAIFQGDAELGWEQVICDARRGQSAPDLSLATWDTPVDMACSHGAIYSAAKVTCRSR